MMVGVWIGLCGLAAAADVPLTVLDSSYVTLGVGGAQRTIPAQEVPLVPAAPGGTIESRDALVLPRITLAFGEYVDPFQNQSLSIELNAATGESTLSFPLWIFDSDGNRRELPVTLGTGVPNAQDCANFPFCLGDESDPAHCAGQAWDPGTGEIRWAGVVLVPFGTGTTVDCSGIFFKIDAVIPVTDGDVDGLKDPVDSCPQASNPSQTDGDGDGIGDACDNCPSVANRQQRDGDGDGTGNACESYRFNFQPPGSVVPAGYELDDGTAFQGEFGHGWRNGRVNVVERNVMADQRLDTFGFYGSENRWETTLPPGFWDVTAAIGDPSYTQGPHRVVVEDAELFMDVMTQAGENLVESLVGLASRDGRLTVQIGGGGGNTAIDYVEAFESAEQPFLERFLNFQPAASALPPGMTMDVGATVVDGYGWDQNLTGQTRDRNVLSDPTLDTMLYTGSPRRFELPLPADWYVVEVSLGDAQYAQGPHRLSVEGELWTDSALTAAGEFVRFSERLLITDGSLTIDLGQAGSNTVITHLAVQSEPRDLDGDGVPNLNDNCLETANPGQEDANLDGVGDLCSVDADGDGVADPVDNCPLADNPGQEDGDSDTVGDACDCSPQNPSHWSVPAEVPQLVVANGPDLLWSDLAAQAGGGVAYDVVRGVTSTLGAGYGTATCIADDQSGTTMTVGAQPAPGQAFYYLVRGVNPCGAGTYGDGERSALDTASPCP